MDTAPQAHFERKTASVTGVSAAPSAFSGPDGPAMADLARCVHCGLCLMHCPTFVATGLETESPRGRIYLMRAAAEGRIAISDGFVGHMELCLQCRNCESVCPSGVPFGRIMERTRAQILRQHEGSRTKRVLRTALTRLFLQHPRAMAAAATAMRVYQHAGPRTALQRTGLLRLLPARVREPEQSMPDVPRRPFRPRATVYPAFGARRHRVGMLTGCVMPYLYPQSERSTLQVLRRNGCEVVMPPEQGCCGALLVHNGDREPARALARRLIDTFLDAKVDAVIVNAAGCGSTMKEYDELLADDDAYAEKARRFVALVRDVTEFLAAHGVDRSALGRIEARVTYQDSCHLAHAQRIRESPRELIRAVPGVELVELASDRCCGSAGIYNLTERAMSLQVLDSKMDEVEDVRPELLVTANPGCMLQLQTGVRRRSLSTRVMHVVDLLEASYQAGERRRG